MSIGLIMLLQWLFFLITGNIPEFETTPVSITFHLLIEIITALALILLFFLLKKPVRRNLLIASYTQGMLGYTVVNSAGYFAQSGQWLFLVMFAILLCFSLMNLILLIRKI